MRFSAWAPAQRCAAHPALLNSVAGEAAQVASLHLPAG
jgi:hypothetical protein